MGTQCLVSLQDSRRQNPFISLKNYKPFLLYGDLLIAAATHPWALVVWLFFWGGCCVFVVVICSVFCFSFSGYS